MKTLHREGERGSKNNDKTGDWGRETRMKWKITRMKWKAKVKKIVKTMITTMILKRVMIMMIMIKYKDKFKFRQS